jgi:hypothetical protein
VVISHATFGHLFPLYSLSVVEIGIHLRNPRRRRLRAAVRAVAEEYAGFLPFSDTQVAGMGKSDPISHHG